MRDGTWGRKLVFLTAAMLGLTAVFASLTLVALGRPGTAAVLAVIGVVVAVVGLRGLPAGS